MKLKPFKAWLLWDTKGTYSPVMHITRKEAQYNKKENDFLSDARWRITRIKISSDIPRSL